MPETYMQKRARRDRGIVLKDAVQAAMSDGAPIPADLDERLLTYIGDLNRELGQWERERGCAVREADSSTQAQRYFGEMTHYCVITKTPEELTDLFGEEFRHELGQNPPHDAIKPFMDDEAFTYADVECIAQGNKTLIFASSEEVAEAYMKAYLSKVEE